MNWFARPSGDTMVAPVDALPGRAMPEFEIPTNHAVLGTPLAGPWPAGHEVIFLAMGCFWGAERKFWQLPGVYSTAVGYQGGYTPHPTYEEVCTGRTGHAEVVQVIYEPAAVPTFEVLKVFWENHDPTQGYRQGNDRGTQYRSAIYWTTPEQDDLAESTAAEYQAVLTRAGLGSITTDLRTAQGLPFYYAEAHHQQYLAKNPHGYDCHASTGLELPTLDR